MRRLRTGKKFVNYELRVDGKIADYGYVSRDIFYQNGGAGLIRGDGIELRVIGPEEGIDEERAKEKWSTLKNRLLSK